MKKEKFSYDVDAISGYTDQEGGLLLTESMVGATTPQYSNIRTGIKGTQQINLLSSTIAVQDGACGWNQSGTTAYTKVDLATDSKKVNEAFCPKDLYTTYQSKLLKAGHTETEVPFEKMIGDLKVKEVQEYIENKLWLADSAGDDGFDGLDKLIATGQTGVANAAGTAFSATAAYGADGNPITEVDKLINALDDDGMSRDDLVVYMSYANFRLYVQALTKANFFQNYVKDANITGKMVATHPNSNVTVVPTKGLNGKGKVVIAPEEFVIIGFDLESDSESFDMWYSQDNDEIRLRINFNYGVTIPSFSTKYFATNNVA